MRPHVTGSRIPGWNLAIAALVLSAAACATFSTKREYCLFQELTKTEDAIRLALVYDMYMTEFPDGVYSDVIEKMRPEIEREIFVAAGSDRGMLWRYLTLFPDGIFAQLTRDKLAQMDAMARFDAERAAAELAQKKAEIDAHEIARQALIVEYNSAIRDWIAFAGLVPYGKDVQALASMSETFGRIWSSEPLATCDATSCVKYYFLDTWYEVQGGTRENRKLELAVKLLFHEGGLIGISLTFPGRGVIPLLEEVDKTPYEMEQETLDGATFLAMDALAQAAEESLPGGAEASEEGALWAWSGPQAKLVFMRKGDLATGLDDALLIQLLPPPPPKPEPGKKPVKKKPKEPVPEPPIASHEDLAWHPAAPPPPVEEAPPPPVEEAPPPPVEEAPPPESTGAP